MVLAVVVIVGTKLTGGVVVGGSYVVVVTSFVVGAFSIAGIASIGGCSY